MPDRAKFVTPGTVFDLDRFVRQSSYSTPGRYADRLAALPNDQASLCAASRNVIAHYRAELPDLPEERRAEIDSRWLVAILALDHQRHPAGLDQPRPLPERVAAAAGTTHYWWSAPYGNVEYRRVTGSASPTTSG